MENCEANTINLNVDVNEQIDLEAVAGEVEACMQSPECTDSTGG